MRIRLITPIAFALVLLAGCAATIDQGGLEQRTAQALGRPVSQFNITDRSEQAGGRVNYSVNTNDGATYSCYLMSASGFAQALSFGQVPHSDAICIAVKGVKSENGHPAPAAMDSSGRAAGGECNALLRAAGRC